ncbi:amidohydrolase [Aquisalinus flavus]|uniref:Amidohydrolase n=2 Tax=Aquisalinus flavus TaxID=1526572 RepID=A0A8J2Y749_9PROT|nr:amidohydrolase [Aquisalinus flavus]
MIYTGSETAPIASYVTIKGGYIDAVGTGPFDLDTVDQASGFDGDIILLDDGQVAYPGFTDAHAHLIGIGQRELTLNLEGTASIAELKQRIAAEAEGKAEGEVIFGRGWIETGWPEGRFPTRDDLDAAAPDNPVVLVRADGHASVANTAALDAAGITDATPDPDGGRIERDANGRATGMLIDTADRPVRALIDEPSEAERREALKKGAEVYASYGWTGLHNMSVDIRDAQIIGALEEAGEMPIRVYNAINPGDMDALIETGIWELNDGKVTTRAVKFYVDGALGSRGAALHEPYTDQPETSGLLLLTPEEAMAGYRQAYDNSIQVTTHAIGDRGNTLVLDWYEDVLPVERLSYDEGPRWRVEHAQIVDPADIPRFAGLGIIASMQPSHAIGDLHFAPARLGEDRLDGAYAWRSLSDSGAIIAGGSDAPVERGDPMIEFYATVARRDLSGYRGENWHPDEALSRGEALDMFTINPAFASFNEDRLGTLEPGKKADITVLDGDIMTVPSGDLPGVKAVMTIVDGEIVYEAMAE